MIASRRLPDPTPSGHGTRFPGSNGGRRNNLPPGPLPLRRSFSASPRLGCPRPPPVPLLMGLLWRQLRGVKRRGSWGAFAFEPCIGNEGSLQASACARGSSSGRMRQATATSSGSAGCICSTSSLSARRRPCSTAMARRLDFSAPRRGSHHSASVRSARPTEFQVCRGPAESSYLVRGNLCRLQGPGTRARRS